jgi:hypothetical protein
MVRLPKNLIIGVRSALEAAAACRSALVANILGRLKVCPDGGNGELRSIARCGSLQGCLPLFAISKPEILSCAPRWSRVEDYEAWGTFGLGEY